MIRVRFSRRSTQAAKMLHIWRRGGFTGGPAGSGYGLNYGNSYGA